MSSMNNVLYENVWLANEDTMRVAIDIASRNSSDMKAVAKAVNKHIKYYAANGVDTALSGRSQVIGSVGVVQITGSIVRYGDAFTDVSGAVSTERIQADIQALLDNPNVGHIVLSIDSGGGMVNGTSSLANLIYENRSRITSHVKGMAASAAYWIGSAASSIYSEDTSSLGNIGAIMAVRKPDSDSVRFISSMSSNKAPDPTTEAGDAEYQKRVDDYGKLFVEAVSLHRGISAEDVVSRFGNGSVFLGAEASKIGLADGVMSLSDLIAKKQNEKGVTMANEPVTKPTQTPDVVTKGDLKAVEARALAAEKTVANMQRVEAIKAVLYAHDGVLSKDAEVAILADASQTEASVSATLLKTISDASIAAPVAVAPVAEKIDNMVMADAILLKAGMDKRDGVQIDASALNPEALEISKLSLKQMVASVTGLDLNSATDTEVTAAMTTGNFPIILSNLQNKIVAEVFEKAPVTYRQWTKSIPLKDFKAVTEVRKGSFGNDFKKLTEGGALRYGTKTEEGLTWQLFRFAKKFALTYEMIINDDLGMFTDDLADLIENVEKFKNRQVYDLLLARGDYAGYVMEDGNPVFDSANHSNNQTTGSAVSIASLGEGFNAIASQTDFDGSSLAIQPRHLIIPFVKQWDVSQVINSTASNEDNKNSATFNPAYGKFNVIPEFELNNQTAWFLAGEKRTIKTGYLASEGESPIVEEVRNSRIHGIEYELAFSFGIVVNDYRAMFKNDGV